MTKPTRAPSAFDFCPKHNVYYKTCGCPWRKGGKKELPKVEKQRKPMKRIGDRGKANLAANKKIPLKDHCEIGALGWPEFTDCMKTWPLQRVHRHERAWYGGDEGLLSDTKQVVTGCQICHAILDRRTEESKELTERVFIRLRGEEI